VLSPVSIQTQLLALRKRKLQETQALALASSQSWLPTCHCFDRAFLLAGACVCSVKFSRNKHKRQPIGMLGGSSGNHDWLWLHANASDCV